MRTLLVGYDLNRPNQNYADLEKVLKAEVNWWHHLDSTWLIVTTKTAEQMRDKILTTLDGNDEVLVVDVTGDTAAWYGFDKEGSDWIKQSL